MIHCPNCSKPNQDHYKFCLACGTKLDATSGSHATGEPPLLSAVEGPPMLQDDAASSTPPLPSMETTSAGTPDELLADDSDPPTLAVSRAEHFGATLPGNFSADATIPEGLRARGTASSVDRTVVTPPSAKPVPPPPKIGSGIGHPPLPPLPPPVSPSVAPPKPSGGTMPARSSSTGEDRSEAFAPLDSAPQAPSAPGVSTTASFASMPPGGPTAAAAAGATEAVACAQCTFVNPSGFRFCGSCGAPLHKDPSPSPAPAAAPQPLGEASAGNDDLGSARTVFAPSARPPSVAEEAAAPTPSSAESSQPHAVAGKAARLVMLGPDGQPVGERLLAPGERLEVGRQAGPPWADDAYLDPVHARLSVVEDGLLVEDHDSLNGIFIKLSRREEIRHGDQFRVGQELLLYEDLPEPTPTEDGTERMGSPNPGYWGRICVLVDPGRPCSAFPIESEGVLVGRELGDITFPQDGYVSGKHCRVSGDDTGVYVEDLGSSNGTYLRVRPSQVVPFGSLILVGQKLFQVEKA